MDVPSANVLPAVPVRSPWREGVRVSAVAGLLGGAVMLAWLVASAAYHDLSPVQPLRQMGSTFVGREALSGGAGIVLYGLLLHAAVSVAVALPFVFLLPRDFPVGSAVVIGLGYAFVVMAVMSSLLAWASPVLRDRMRDLGGAWAIANSLYGATMALYAQRLRRRPR
jgi:hypothetical protein